jgi:peptidoglycan/LPS O-acetylase OafA/YrhL
VRGLDTLRAVAVLWVVLYHLHGAKLTPPLPDALERFAALGSAGVDLFFVLSGYLIGGIVLAELETTGTLRARHFWWRRWLRTLPAYYATLALIAGSDFVVSPEHAWVSTWAYPIFLQNYWSERPRFAWSWSLCVEEHFYLALPIGCMR